MVVPSNFYVPSRTRYGLWRYKIHVQSSSLLISSIWNVLRYTKGQIDDRQIHHHPTFSTVHKPPVFSRDTCLISSRGTILYVVFHARSARQAWPNQRARPDPKHRFDKTPQRIAFKMTHSKIFNPITNSQFKMIHTHNTITLYSID